MSSIGCFRYGEPRQVICSRIGQIFPARSPSNVILDLFLRNLVFKGSCFCLRQDRRSHRRSVRPSSACVSLPTRKGLSPFPCPRFPSPHRGPGWAVIEPDKGSAFGDAFPLKLNFRQLLFLSQPLPVVSLLRWKLFLHCLF